MGTSGMSFVEKPPYYSNPHGKIAILSSMYTLKEYRKKGIAKELLDRVVKEGKDYGCGAVQITASDREFFYIHIMVLRKTRTLCNIYFSLAQI